MTRTGFEPMNACVKGMCVEPLHQRAKTNKMVGLNGLEPSTSRLSGVRSNHLSYKPILHLLKHYNTYTNYLAIPFLKLFNFFITKQMYWWLLLKFSNN